MTDRYERLEHHADAGLGADELGVRRFTRPTERTPVSRQASTEVPSTSTHERN